MIGISGSIRPVVATRALAVAAALLAAGLVGGCSGDSKGEATGDSSSTSPAAASVTPPPASTATPSVGVSQKPAVRIGQPAKLSQNVTVRVVGTAPVTLTAKGPGEIAGPGAKVVIRVTNDSEKSIDLGVLAVNAYYGAKNTPASPSTFHQGSQLSGKLKSGASATGTYYFRVPSSKFGTLDVEVSSGASPYVLTFVHS
jgi:hypothetical protein